MVTKVNPNYDPTEAKAFLGKTLTKFTVGTGIVDITGSTQPYGAIDTIMNTLSSHATVVAVSDITATGFDFMVEGEFPVDTYDGTTSQSFAAYLEGLVQSLGTVDGLDLSAVTITEDKVYKA